MRIRQNARKNFLKLATLQLLLSGLLIIVPSSASALTTGHAVDIQAGGLPTVNADKDTVGNILAIFFGIIGAFAVLNITLSGLKYITSAGDPQKTSEAKSGIVYSIVGLMIAVTAEAIVAFVVSGVGK